MKQLMVILVYMIAVLLGDVMATFYANPNPFSYGHEDTACDTEATVIDNDGWGNSNGGGLVVGGFT